MKFQKFQKSFEIAKHFFNFVFFQIGGKIVKLNGHIVDDRDDVDRVKQEIQAFEPVDFISKHFHCI